MGNPQARTARTARPTPAKAPAEAPIADAATGPNVAPPPVGRQRGADPNRMIAHYVRMCAEKDQQIAAANALVDELEEALAAEQETNEGLRTELVAATSGDAPGQE